MITRKTMKNSFLAKTLCLTLSLFLLSGCVTDQQTNPFDSMQGMKKEREARLSTAATEAINSGKTKEALTLYTKLYDQKPNNKEVALNYAQLLRKTGETEDAVKVLTPFVGDITQSGALKFDTALMTNELAASYIQLGYFQEAEEKLSLVLDNPNMGNLHADASNLMGIAKDAQSQHKAAEKLFRLSLEHWQGDATSVMNNLALSLASQAKFDESLNLLRRALIMAPEKTELARNIDVVSALRNAVIPKAPVNLKK